MNLFQFTPTQYLFLSFVLGFAAGLWFEFFRILRRAFPHGVFAVALEDLLFFAVTAPCYWFLCFGAALGRVRWFSVFALVTGFCVYLLSLGRLLSALSGAIIAFFKRLFRKAANAVCGVLGFLFSPIRRLYSSLCRALRRRRRSRQLKRFLRAASRAFR